MADPIIPAPPARPLAVPSSSTAMTIGSALAVGGTLAGAYHGYKRDRSVGWAILWALAGGAFPIITIPIALAQGFGKPATSGLRSRK